MVSLSFAWLLSAAHSLSAVSPALGAGAASPAVLPRALNASWHLLSLQMWPPGSAAAQGISGGQCAGKLQGLRRCQEPGLKTKELLGQWMPAQALAPRGHREGSAGKRREEDADLAVAVLGAQREGPILVLCS